MASRSVGGSLRTGFPPGPVVGSPSRRHRASSEWGFHNVLLFIREWAWVLLISLEQRFRCLVSIQGVVLSHTGALLAAAGHPPRPPEGIHIQCCRSGGTPLGMWDEQTVLNACFHGTWTGIFRWARTASRTDSTEINFMHSMWPEPAR